MGSTIFLFFLLSIPFSHQNPKFLVTADANLIQKTCKKTNYYNFCVSTLKSDPKSQNADPKGLAVTMVGIGISNATATSSFLSSQTIINGTTSGSASSANDTNMKRVLRECADKYRYAGGALQASVQDLAAEDYDYASIHITAAADYPNACHNAFRRYAGMAYPVELAKREDWLKRICDVALGIIDNFAWN